jgi:SRSO17 transposase
LQQMRQALADGVPPAVALMDPAYGNDSKLRAGISELGLSYVAGILPSTMVWRPGEVPLPPASRAGRGRPGKRLRRDATHRPVPAKTLALELDVDAWQPITWRDGSNTPLTSRFARWRVRPAHDDAGRSEPAAEESLLIEWPEGAAEPDHYWLSETVRKVGGTLRFGVEPAVSRKWERPGAVAGDGGAVRRSWRQAGA